MRKHFIFAREARPGHAWLARFAAGRAEAERWYRGEGRAPPPDPIECRAALVRHMPELVPEYDRVCALVGDDPLAHQILSHYRPPPLTAGCSQAVWLGRDGPALLRNYDFPLDIVSERFEATAWFGREVIAKAQRPWGGCIDGMNADGLVASLTAGGTAQGRGFSVILILRYVLETCRQVSEAVAALCRIPIALSQNVTVLDRSGAYATVFLGPDREPAVSYVPACTNHQESVGAGRAMSAAAVSSIERQALLLRLLEDPAMTVPGLLAQLLEPPLYSRRAASPTVYRPDEGTVDYIWPGATRTQRLGAFAEGEYSHDYCELTP